MATPNPLEHTFASSAGSSASAPTISARKFLISGLVTTVYGLEELTPAQNVICCLWLLHPRLQTHECMEPVAAACIHAWKAHLNAGDEQNINKGLIAVAFDQRNHGSRLISAQANEAWKGGNPTHAQDMFSSYEGTSHDISQLQPHLESYIFPITRPGKLPEKNLTRHYVLGISLGGHAAWHSLVHNGLVTAGVSIIGCPDYLRLMCDRARKSKLPTYMDCTPTGKDFLGSKDFPTSLYTHMFQSDPAAVLMWPFVEENTWNSVHSFETDPPIPHPPYVPRLRERFARVLSDKRILNLAGGADKLVPYAAAAPFIQFLEDATETGLGPAGHGCPPRLAAKGWYEDGGLEIRNNVYPGVAHEVTPAMMDEAKSVIVQVMAEEKEMTARHEQRSIARAEERQRQREKQAGKM